MPSILRPTFFENQILGPEDLTTAVDHARGQLARHARQQHTWGIVAGLDLSANNGLLHIAPGAAVDGTGREIVIPEAIEIDGDHLGLNQLVDFGQAEEWCPIYLMPDEREGGTTSSASLCASGGGPVRQEEWYAIEAGAPGTADALLGQSPPESVTPGPAHPDAGPEISGTDPWRILLGFVQYDRKLEKVTKAAESAGEADDKVTRRFAGVRADEVEARNGRLVERVRPLTWGEKPATMLDEDEKGLRWRVGTETALGVFNEFFRVSAGGNLTVKGSIDVAGGIKAGGAIKAPLEAGKMAVKSGEVSDGMPIPLPDGITQEMVDDGAALHIILTPILPDNPPLPANTSSLPIVRTCEFDDNRIVKCRVAWLMPGAATFMSPGDVRYVVIGSPK